MTGETAAGIALIVTPVWFNVWFFALARRFEYPDILRKPTSEILSRFRAGGPPLILMWWAFMLSGGSFVAAAVLVWLVFTSEARILSTLAVFAGVLAGSVQMIGLLRWVYLVPALARIHAEASEPIRSATEVTFRAFHQYVGVGIGEHLGYLLTGVWTLLAGLAIVRSTVVSAAFGWIAIPIGIGLVVASAEFLGPNEEHGWAPAGAAVPILYVAWSVWMLALGIVLVV